MSEQNEQQLWDVYYSGVVGWCLHPRSLEKESRSVDEMLRDSADIVDKMIKIRRERCLG